MKKKPRIAILATSTVCVLMIYIANFIDYLKTGNQGLPLSNFCFIAAGICIVIGWGMYFWVRKRMEE